MRPSTTQKMLAWIITLVLFSGFVWINKASAWTATITAVGEDIEDTNVVIGVASEAHMSQPTQASEIMNLYTLDGTVLSEDIRQEGNMRYTWIIWVNPNGNIVPLDPARTATLSWEPLDFGAGTYTLRDGADETGAIVVADMKTTDSYVVEGIRFFTLIFTEADNDDDGVPDSIDNCPNDPNKTEPGVCGCGIADIDSDGDGVLDCNDTDDDGSGGGGCFIATAAYGTPFEGHVIILRQFRDAYLLPTNIGRAFVDLYWKYSPPLADFIAKHDGLRAAVRIGLTPVVGVAYVALHTTTAQKMILVMVLLGLLTGVYMKVRRFKWKRAA